MVLVSIYMIWCLLQTSSDFDAKPMVMLLGQYSTGKTTFIKHLLKCDYPGRLSCLHVFHVMYRSISHFDYTDVLFCLLSNIRQELILDQSLQQIALLLLWYCMLSNVVLFDSRSYAI